MGTWAQGIEEYFVLQPELLNALASKLQSSDKEDQDYVFKFFLRYIPRYAPVPTPYLRTVLINGLRSGDVRFRDALLFVTWEEDVASGWKTALGSAVDQFVEKPKSEAQQVDFGITDDDVPF